jgi:hypothetical protein
MQGLGRPGVHQVKMIEWGLRTEKKVFPMPVSTLYPSTTGILNKTDNQKLNADWQFIAWQKAQIKPGEYQCPNRFIPRTFSCSF